MRILLALLVVAVILLGFGAGLAKVVEAPLEAAAFQRAGYGLAFLSLFGAVQIVCAVLMLFPRTRLTSGVVLAATFGVSGWVLGQAGQTNYALLSWGI